MDLRAEIERCFERARGVCDNVYMRSPAPRISVQNGRKEVKTVRIAAVPDHVEYVVFELLKNAMRATVEATEDHEDLPDISVRIVQTPGKDVAVRIGDRGVGIPRWSVPFVNHFGYTTVPGARLSAETGRSTPVMAGLGYGIPMSRLYARYFKVSEQQEEIAPCRRQWFYTRWGWYHWA